MNFLLVEDDSNKAKQVNIFLTEQYPNCAVEIRKSYQSGLKAIVSNNYDLILLDMQLPTFDIKSGEDGYRFRKLAGWDILNELRRKGNSSKVVILTQFETHGEGDNLMEIDDLREELKSNYRNNYVGLIYYDPAQNQWRRQISSLLKKMFPND